VKTQIKFLSVTRVLLIHDRLVKRIGGSAGVRDMGLIESAVARPQSGFNGKYLYTNIFDMAAALLQSLLKNHPFVDGNKRTALTSASIFLEINGYLLNRNDNEIVEFAVRVDNANLTLEEISEWLEKNTKDPSKF